MKNYCQLFNFPIELYREECLKVLGNVDFSLVRPYDKTYEEMLDVAPNFMNIILKNFKILPLWYRYYVTPKFKQLNPHIDGGEKGVPYPFSLNLPIIGAENTTTIWYDSSDVSNQRKLSTVDHYYSTGIIAKNSKKLKEVYKQTIDKPTFIKTDIFHAVKNPNSTTRIMLTFRWQNREGTKGYEIKEPIEVLNQNNCVN